MSDLESMLLPSSEMIIVGVCTIGYYLFCRWNRMPKHIKVSKHADTKKFFVSDVCEFLSVEVSHLSMPAHVDYILFLMKELVAYYQHNSLGSSFPGVDTTLRYPYRDMIDGGATTRVPSPRNMARAASPTSDTNSSQLVERWADAMFTFHAEYPDELTIDVCT